ncbi:hypothetical protein BWX39_05165 [Prevotella intermedia ATCC 25611 = DSM 20706]|uniref:hypothetical protein n=1 Tax=Prevotella intermedia TaxID=28131 RepID=UPI000421AD79|nr:hypothetical protein [Prevotella intermedia]APW32078.1 hypothetical protein BWX39_05165 [Prevotella intermedia ATCC 25611 = DSM 20706]SUB95029.1 Uncharacterised protein [Prevotella intermedia]
MKKVERASIVRVLIDLIKADLVIDEYEMVLYAKLKQEYNISREDEISASSMTLADAVMPLADSTPLLRKSLIESFSKMSVSDGFCAEQEAQLIFALIFCLSEEFVGMTEMYSVHEPEVTIEDNQVIYVEPAFDNNINSDITNNYRSIDKEFHLAGFYFIYIPFISNHYKKTDIGLFKEIAKILAPTIPENNIPILVKNLQNITTAEYCSEQLCNKLGIHNLRDVPPSLLFKISNTYVGDKLYTNFLRITIDNDVLPLMQDIVDRYIGMLISGIRFVKNTEEAHGQFMYHGFYKQLFDIYVLQRGVKSGILLDLIKGSLFLPELSLEITGLHRRDKALYVLLLIESENGGLNFSLPMSVKEKRNYENRMKSMQNKYNLIYHALNGDKASAPRLEDPEIRRPIISNIRRCINKMSDVLHNVNDYNVSKNSYGNFCVNIPLENVLVREYGNERENVPIRK